MSVVVEDRRKSTRDLVGKRFEVSLIRPEGVLLADGINVSRGGICCRLNETLEVRSLVKLKIASAKQVLSAHQAVECAGRVMWVVQRLDLRSDPPFLFDVGIEFIKPPSLLQKLTHRRSSDTAGPRLKASAPLRLTFAQIRGRTFVPRLSRTVARPLSWHLVVTVDGVPCFSGHFASQQSAMSAWDKFKRQKTRR
ncbi:MAG: PilZ domain-containing protein [Candidatus Omnitrophica bacterium]|nr:PilZ domain-containing protein [Candidatus Omnitrophota bacterium]MBI2173991.1 PilZ domain-containing protein [Candidatus Omnitrophota bacterium]MBI3009720.1 PilZ domain-containing protein [Candidatus Omnitrophota bacterium]